MKKFYETDLTPFQARYGKEVPDNDYPTNAFVEGIIKRKTIRRYDTNRPIDPKLMEKLIAAAQSAPTSSMLQPWSVLSIRSKEGKEKLLRPQWRTWLGATIGDNPDAHKATPADPGNITAIMECDTILLWMVDCTITDEVIRNSETYEADPALNNWKERVTECSTGFDMETRAMTDAIIAAQTFALAAESVGLGVMYCGSFRNLELWDFYRLPKRSAVLFGMTVGWPAQMELNSFGLQKISATSKVYTKPRLPQELIFRKELYYDTDKEYAKSWTDDPFTPERFEKVKEYNSLMRDFYRIHHSDWDWFNRIIKRTYRSRNKHRWVVTFSGFFKYLKNILD